MAASTAAAPSAKADTKDRLKALLSNQQFILLVVLAVLIAYFDIRRPVFLSSGEIATLLTDFSSLILLAVAETYVIISGGIDLSVGGTAGFAGVVGAFAMRKMLGGHAAEPVVLLVGTLVCAAVGLGIGLLNAILMNWARLVPFVATLATMGAAGGMSLVLTQGAPIGDDSHAIIFTQSKFGPFSYPVLIVIALTIIAGIYLHMTRYGRFTYAIGSNSFAARAAGINVKRHITSVYVLSGVLAGLTGMFLYLRLGQGAPTSGAGNELDAIAAVVIGGASLTGGVGRMTGSILGALILTTVTSGLIIINLNSNWKEVAVAALIALAATMQALRPGTRMQR